MQIVVHDDVMVDNFDWYVMMTYDDDGCVVDGRLTAEKRRKEESSTPRMNLQLIEGYVIMQEV